MFKLHASIAAAAFAIATAAGSTAGTAQETEVVFAIPALTLTFSSHYVAEDGGFFKKEGLKVTTRNLVGVASTNAVIAGSAEFSMSTGPVLLRAAAQGQKLLTIANLVDRPLVEFVLRKDVAERLGITREMPLAERAKRLKGTTIAIQGVGSIIHAWERYVVAKGGLDVEKDVRIAPMDPPAMLPALESKAIDGYVTSLPFTTLAVGKGQAMMLATAVTDAPELLPFGYGLLYTRAEVCQSKRELCQRMARAYIGAAKMIQEKPDEIYETILKKRFPEDGPGAVEVRLGCRAEGAREGHQGNAAPARKLAKGQFGSQAARSQGRAESYKGIYTDEFVR